MYQTDIFKQQVKIEPHKARQRTRRTHAEQIDAFGANQCVDRALKRVAVDFIQRLPDHIHIRMQYGLEHVAPAHAVTGNLHTLHRSQLVADHLLQGALQMRIAVVAQLGGKAHHS